MSFFALGMLKNHNVPHLHPNSTMFMPLDRLQLKIYAFSGKFNVCSKRLFLSWIKICRDFTLQTQIFTQKYRSWLRFYSEFLRKKLAVGGSAGYVWLSKKYISWDMEDLLSQCNGMRHAKQKAQDVLASISHHISGQGTACGQGHHWKTCRTKCQG